MHVVMQIHRGLFRYLPDGTIKPDLVEKYEISSDRKKVSIKLKSEVFSDGTPLVSDDVIRTFKRLFKVDASISGDLRGIRGTHPLSETNFGFQKIDEKNFVIYFDSPNALLEALLATPDCSIVKLSKDGELLEKVGLGPYVVEKMDSKSITLKYRKNTAEVSANPPGAIIYKLGVTRVKEPTEDYVLDLYDFDTDEATSYIKKGWAPSVSDATRERFAQVNDKRLSLEDRKVIFNSIDTVALVAELNQLSFKPAYGLIPFGLPGARNQSSVAKRPGLKSKLSTVLSISYPESWKDGEKIFMILSHQLAKSGFKVTARKQSFTDWMQSKKSHDFDILLNARGIDYPDAYAILGYFRSGVAQNYLQIQDPQIDRLLDEAIAEFDFTKRIKTYDRIEDKVLDHYLVVPLTFGATNSGLWPSVAKFVPPHPLGFHYLSLALVEMR